MIHGLGAIPDRTCDVEYDLRRRHVGQLVGAAPVALPSHVDYSSLLDEVPHQLRSNGCVGFAFATVLYLRAKIIGRPIERPSAKAIWDGARLVDTPNVLTNVGSRPRAALETMSIDGLVAESRWPLTAENYNVKPTLDVFRAGCGATLSGHYRIGGGDVATLAQQALAKGFPVFFAMPVDEVFDRISDGSIYEGALNPLGNHALALVGYNESGGVRSFLVANSWGSGWGMGGLCRISDRVLNQLAFDVIVPTLIPEVVR